MPIYPPARRKVGVVCWLTHTWSRLEPGIRPEFCFKTGMSCNLALPIDFRESFPILLVMHARSIQKVFEPWGSFFGPELGVAFLAINREGERVRRSEIPSRLLGQGQGTLS